MGTIIQLTDSNYSSGMDSIRKRVSPFAISPITAEQLPNDFIDDPIFVNPAEATVIADKETTVAAVALLARDSAELETLQILTWLRIAIELIAQAPQQLAVVALSMQDRYAEIDWQDRILALERSYQRILNPAGDSGVGDLFAKAKISNSRIY